MEIRQPIPHWNNFSVLELKQIVIHLRALEKLGIAQDEEMMISIERDITMREKINTKPSKSKLAKTKQIERQEFSKIDKRVQPRKLLLEQTV